MFITPKNGQMARRTLESCNGACCFSYATWTLLSQNCELFCSSYTTHKIFAGSICSEDRIGIVSGYIHSHQTGTYDVFRGIMHIIGLSFGAKRDDLTKRECNSEEYTYINPFPNHPIQMLNVGMRTHSRMLSPCAQDRVSQYLTEPHLCLIVEDGMKPFCGNGEFL